MPSKSPAAVAHPPVGTIIDNGNLELIQVLGIGGYGVVYRALDSSLKSYAVKCLMYGPNETASHRQVRLREITLHQLASSHRNIVSLHRIVEDPERGCTYIVMDFASDGDLFSQILNNCRYLGNDFLIKHVFMQLLDAVEYIHSLGIFHRDLKPENILCFEDGLHIALTDFGLATTSKFSQEFRTGSVYHMSPECRGGDYAPTGSYSPRSNDMWSLGIIFLNLATGRNPWKSASLSDNTFQAYIDNPNGFLQTVLPISDEFNMLLIRMLEIDWRDRLTIPELRRAMGSISSFYSPSAIFDGSMARCPWELGLEATASGPSTKAESDIPPEIPSKDLKSKWSVSSTSAIVFASRQRKDSLSFESWSELSGDSQDDMDVSLDRPVTPRSSRSFASQCSSTPSWPTTPADVKGTFQTRMPAEPSLAIDTNYSRYYNCNDTNYSSSDSDLVMHTAVDDRPYASSLFFGGAPSPSKSMTSKSPTDDGEMSTDPPDSFWHYSATEASFSSRYSQDDIPNLHDLIQDPGETGPREMVWTENQFDPMSDSSSFAASRKSEKSKPSHLFIKPAKYSPRSTSPARWKSRPRAQTSPIYTPPDINIYNCGRSVRHWFRANKKITSK